jgi:hypothetical protein
MATQYTAGLTTGQVLTAAIMNQIGAAWETWTPTVTASSGTFTTITVNKAKYCQIQKTVIAFVDFTITTIGTATGIPIFTVPVTQTTVQAGGAQGSWRETNVSGETGVVTWQSTTTSGLQRYDNAAVLTASDRYVATFTYEAA